MLTFDYQKKLIQFIHQTLGFYNHELCWKYDFTIMKYLGFYSHKLFKKYDFTVLQLQIVHVMKFLGFSNFILWENVLTGFVLVNYEENPVYTLRTFS